MKQKIKDALKQRYNNLGLGDEAFEGVASSVATFITDETLEQFVTGAEPILKQYQSIADKARSQKTADLEAKIAGLEAKLAGHKDETTDSDTKEVQKKDEQPDMATIIADAIAKANQPLMDKIAALENVNTVKQNVATAKDAFFGGDYMKKFKDEADEAWDRAMEIYEIGGSKLSADELKAKAVGYFDKAVAKKGVDTSKPFEGDGGSDATVDWAEERKRLQDAGKIAADK